MEQLLKSPLLARKWRYLAYALFPFPMLLLLVFMLTKADISFDVMSMLLYGSWIIAISLLINIRKKEEDEMIEKIRLIAYQRGVYFLMSGLVAIIIIELVKGNELTTQVVSVFEALLLLVVYIYVTFQFLLWKLNQD